MDDRLCPYCNQRPVMYLVWKRGISDDVCCVKCAEWFVSEWLRPDGNEDRLVEKLKRLSVRRFSTNHA